VSVTAPRVGVLECDHVRPELRSIAGDYRDMFAALLPAVELVPYDVRAGVLPSSPNDCDGWICTGSSASVYEGASWVEDLSGFVRAARADGSPFVGICFGHQLLAQALGGGVERASVGWGAGAHRLTVQTSEPWMDPPLDEVILLYSHQDQVTEVPDGGRILGSTGHCPVAMLQIDETMLGIQGHPEFGAPYLRALIDLRVDRIGHDGADRARASLSAPRDEIVVGAWIRAFLGLCHWSHHAR
jgi:GMP synthase-like glutamine amidotransferase